MLQKQLKTKIPKIPDQACANGFQLHDIPQDLQSILPLERRGYFFTNPIHNNICHEMIWWPLQSKWSTCQFSSNTRSNNRNMPCMPSELQPYPVTLNISLDTSHYMYDMICRDCVISAITWVNEHNSHYADIKCNEC